MISKKCTTCCKETHVFICPPCIHIYTDLGQKVSAQQYSGLQPRLFLFFSPRTFLLRAASLLSFPLRFFCACATAVDSRAAIARNDTAMQARTAPEKSRRGYANCAREFWIYGELYRVVGISRLFACYSIWWTWISFFFFCGGVGGGLIEE